ncbi:MAG: hypothetical protein AB7O56_11910 [Bauldia sp.]
MAIDLHGSALPGRDTPFDQRLSDLIERLARARRRVTLNALLSGAIVSIVIGLGVFCVLQLLSGLFGSSWPVAFSFNLNDTFDRAVGQHIVVALIVAAAAFVAALVTAMSGRPWINSMARAADVRFRLNEMMSTALEVAAERRSGVVSEALLQSAQARVGSVDADALVPMRAPRIVFAIPVLLALAVWLAISPPPAVFERAFGGTAGGPEIATTELAARAQTAADLHAIAAIVRQDGEERADPTMQAIARQLDDLAAQMEANPALDREAAGAALERLNDLLATAYERAGEAEDNTRNHSRLLQNAFEQFDPARAAAAAQREAATRPPPEQANPEAAGIDAPFEAVGLRGGEVEGAGNAGAPMPGLGIRPENLDGAAQGPGNRAEILSDEYLAYGEDDVYGPEGPDGPGGPIPAGGEFVAPAAGGEAGDIAGLGGAALFGDAAAMTALEAAGEMMLADRNPGNGRTITLDLPPLTQLLGVTADGAPAPGAWQAQVEGQVTRTPVPVGDRATVQRYFDALMAERTE